jgi:DNA repair protein RadC
MQSDSIKPHYLGHRKRLRDRFKKAGLASFQDYEAVELLLTLAIPRKDVKIPAKEAIKKFGSFHGVLDAPLEELRKIPGIGEVAPLAIRFIREAATLYLQPKSQTDLSIVKIEPETVSLQDPKILFDYCRAAIGAQPNEIFKVIYLDSRYRVIDLETLTEGTIDRATVYPRKVMESALKKRASILVFAHNHPDGNISPSEQDKTITRALILAAKTLNINILDHLIVSKDEVFSFRKEGLL